MTAACKQITSKIKIGKFSAVRSALPCCSGARHIRSRSINEIWQPIPLLSISIKTLASAPVASRQIDKYFRK